MGRRGRAVTIRARGARPHPRDRYGHRPARADPAENADDEDDGIRRVFKRHTPSDISYGEKVVVACGESNDDLWVVARDEDGLLLFASGFPRELIPEWTPPSSTRSASDDDPLRLLPTRPHQAQDRPVNQYGRPTRTAPQRRRHSPTETGRPTPR